MENNIQSKMIEELGLSGLPTEKQHQLMMKMTEALLKRIFLGTVEKLSDADKEAYEKMIDNQASPEEIEKFLREKIVDYDQMLDKAISEFKAEMTKV